MAEMPEIQTSIPEISVVMATFAGDNVSHLRQTLESIQNQTWADFECLLVLDGPIPDATRDWLLSVQTADNRFRVLPQDKNSGAAIARNTGIRNAQGNYIAICDADDVNAPNRLAVQRDYLAKSNLDLIGSWYRIIDDQNNVIAEKQVPVNHASLCKIMCWFNPLGNSTIFAKAEILKQYPYPEDYESRELGEDFDLWIQLIKAGYTFGNMPEYLVDFRMDKAFLRRRSGWKIFLRDLRNKWNACMFYPPWQRPWARIIAVTTSLARLLPNVVLKPLYRLRYRCRF